MTAPLMMNAMLMSAALALVQLATLRQLRRRSGGEYGLWQGFWLALAAGLLTLVAYKQWPSANWLLLPTLMLMHASALMMTIAARRMGERARSSGLKNSEALLMALSLLTLAPTTVIWHAGSEDEFWATPAMLMMAMLMAAAGRRHMQLAVRESSRGWSLLATACFAWAGLDALLGALMAINAPWLTTAGFLLPLIAAAAGASMLVVAGERESRRRLQAAQRLSTLGVESATTMTADDAQPAIEKLLECVLEEMEAGGGALFVTESWSGVLPPAVRYMEKGLIDELRSSGVGEELCRLARLHGGLIDLNERTLVSEGEAGVKALEMMRRRGAEDAVAALLESQGRQMGLLIVRAPHLRQPGAPSRELLRTMAAQLASTQDNYALMSDALHRSRQYLMLSQIGQVISSHLDPDDVLKAIHVELGRLFDTGTFYVAFADGGAMHYEFETVDGVRQPKRSEALSNNLAGYILKSGEPLLLSNRVSEHKKQLHITDPGRGALSFVGVPVKMGGRTSGVICAVSFDREMAYTQRDLEVLVSAAGHLAVAMENALLYSEASRRAQYLSFLNAIAGIAIANQGADLMLTAIAEEIQKNFDFDYICIGVVDPARQEIELRAEAGDEQQRRIGRRVALGVGVMGRTARTNETAVVQNTNEPNLLGVLRDARSILCLPLHYGQTLYGLLNIESRRENAFTGQDVLLFNTLADLLGAALNNTLIFQRMQQQSITDALTGVKTRRYFLEALQTEWKRAQRVGRAFSIVLIDLDKFKQVNDELGHLEGDQILTRAARLLEAHCRQSNIVARYGGDEFVVLVQDSDSERAAVLAERLRKWFANDPMLHEHHVTGSFGVAAYPEHGSTIEEIIGAADSGMYQSKRAGGNRVTASAGAGALEATAERRLYLLHYMERFLQRATFGPESCEEFVGGCQRAVEQLPTDKAGELLTEILLGLAHAAELRENDRGSHGEDVASYARAVGEGCRLSEEELRRVELAGRLHDIGKIFIPASVLNSPRLLTTEEFQQVATHAAMGERLATILPNSAELRRMMRHHHERLDGSGYPDQLMGADIPLGARILAVCDAFVIMTSEHPYSAAKSPAEALSDLENSPQLYDSKLVALLARHVRGEQRPEVLQS